MANPLYQPHDPDRKVSRWHTIAHELTDNDQLVQCIEEAMDYAFAIGCEETEAELDS